MPATPLHLGPGTALKAVLGSRMSLSVFAFSQITMDLEVLVRIAVDAQQLHGFTNTILGATAILAPSVLAGRPVCQTFLRWWNSRLSPSQKRWMGVDPAISWRAAWLGGALGIFSHVFLDAVMHVDAHLWAPLSPANPFVGLLSHEALNMLCLWTLIGGVSALGVGRGWKRRKVA
jgi:hypothetical protein